MDFSPFVSTSEALSAAISRFVFFKMKLGVRDVGRCHLADANFNASTTYTAITGVQISEGLPPTNTTAVFSGSARLNDTTIKTQAGSNLAISRLDNAMANVDHELAVYGSIMNRLTYAGDNLTNVSQNTSFSRSRILDTDYASATTELARTQIIQQAGMAMLAQANQQPQTVLALLQ
jgi:flagellin